MKKILSIIAALGIGFCTKSAYADNIFSLHIETGVAVPLTAPQSSLYVTGPVLSAKGMFALNPYLSLGPSVSAMYLPRATDNNQNAGVLWEVGPALRFQGDHRVSNSFFNGISPWIDIDAMMAVTGKLVLPAFDVGAGIEGALTKNHSVWMGPFVRYSHVFQAADFQDSVSLDKHDVNMLQAGLSISWDAGAKPRTIYVDRKVVEHDIQYVTPKETVKEVIVTKEVVKVDFTEKVYFDVDKSTLRWESRDKLDAIVKKLNDHPNLKIKVSGYASSDGQLAHNVKLANLRTQEVVNYLSSHGVDSQRLIVESFGVSNPAAPNTSKEGRERNRRVEFTVNFTSIK